MNSDQPALALDAEGRVAVNLACSRCRYNLRTLPSAGPCTECGHSVLESATARNVQLAGGAWLLVRGSWLMALVTALSIAALVAAVMQSVERRPRLLSGWDVAINLRLAALTVLPALVALLLTSRPHWAARSAPHWRLFVRVVLLAYLALVLSTKAAEWLASNYYRQPRGLIATWMFGPGRAGYYPKGLLLVRIHEETTQVLMLAWLPLCALILIYTAWLVGIYGLRGLRWFGVILAAAIGLCIVLIHGSKFAGVRVVLPRDADLAALIVLWGGWTLFSLMVAAGISARVRAAARAMAVPQSAAAGIERDADADSRQSATKGC
ncbi:MAG: hypothetical protein IPM64_06765 [Phycisphaerales bacterium]|nr:hypothetical protein [Phycisphaerales bacterium]